MSNGAIALMGALLLLAAVSIAVENWVEARRRLRVRKSSYRQSHAAMPRGAARAWLAMRWLAASARDRDRRSERDS